MKISKDAKRTARRYFRACFTNEVFDETTARAVLDHVIAEKPRHYLAILTVFQRLVRLEVARSTADVESATPLSDPLQADVQRRLTQLYGRPLATAFRVNAALIGGVRVTVGSDVWDGTVKNRLETLRMAV